ncbi:hypothetical protein J6590_073748 [Homalodisca vitripennis]|nr:hypothetical protein J6590_073748 [Homalodisca vitripennis]
MTCISTDAMADSGSDPYSVHVKQVQDRVHIAGITIIGRYYPDYDDSELYIIPFSISSLIPPSFLLDEYIIDQ